MLLWKQLDLDLTRLDLNEPSKTRDLIWDCQLEMQSAVLPLNTWTGLCSHRVWPACVSCQLPDRWMVPSQLDLIQLSSRFHNFQTALLSFLLLPSFYVSSHLRVTAAAELSVSLLSGCLSVLPHSWQSSCPTNTVQAGFNDSLGREGLKSYRWVMNQRWDDEWRWWKKCRSITETGSKDRSGIIYAIVSSRCRPPSLRFVLDLCPTSSSLKLW